MFGDKLKNIKALIKTQREGSNKKKIENLVMFLVLLIITIIAINIILGDNKKSNQNENPKATEYTQLSSENYNNSSNISNKIGRASCRERV